MIQQTLEFPPNFRNNDPGDDGDSYYVYLIECVTENHWYVGQTRNMGQRWNIHIAGRASFFTHEHGAKRIAKIWGPFKSQKQVLKIEDEKRLAAAYFFGDGCVVSNGRISRNIKGKVITGWEESTLGQHVLGEPAQDIYEQMNIKKPK